jgi:MoxR-like ATPase
LLAVARTKAPLVAEFRQKALSARRRNNILADSAKLIADPNFRDQLRELLENGNPGIVGIRQMTPWPADQNALRMIEAFGTASASLLGWPQEIDGIWLDRPELSQLKGATSPTESKIVALLGPPGTGKSALLARLGSVLKSEGHVLLGIKADLLPPKYRFDD